MKIRHRMKRLCHRACAGYTLAEALVVLLILLMVTGTVVAGITAAQSAYFNVVDAANAEVLFSTTMTALRDELGTAKRIVVDGETGALKYYESATLKCLVTLDDSAGDGVRIVYLNGSLTPDDTRTVQLVSRAAATAKLHTELEDITYADGAFRIRGLVVYKDSVTAPLAGDTEDVFSIRPLNPPEHG